MPARGEVPVGFNIPGFPSDHVVVSFPSTNKVFRAEMRLLGGQPCDHPHRRGREEYWVLPADRLQKMAEAIEDLYPGWRILFRCERCKVISDDVSFRSVGGDLMEICPDCYAKEN